MSIIFELLWWHHIGKLLLLEANSKKPLHTLFLNLRISNYGKLMILMSKYQFLFSNLALAVPGLLRWPE